MGCFAMEIEHFVKMMVVVLATVVFAIMLGSYGTAAHVAERDGGYAERDRGRDAYRNDGTAAHVEERDGGRDAYRDDWSDGWDDAVAHRPRSGSGDGYDRGYVDGSEALAEIAAESARARVAEARPVSVPSRVSVSYAQTMSVPSRPVSVPYGRPVVRRAERKPDALTEIFFKRGPEPRRDFAKEMRDRNARYAREAELRNARNAEYMRNLRDMLNSTRPLHDCSRPDYSRPVRPIHSEYYEREEMRRDFRRIVDDALYEHDLMEND